MKIVVRSTIRFRWYCQLVIALCAFFLLAPQLPEIHGREAAYTPKIDFFWARDCPHCESVQDFVRGLEKTYSIKVKNFDVDKETDYQTFTRTGERYGKNPPAVPLIVVGSEVLMGEAEIKARLEGIIRSLIQSNKSSSLRSARARRQSNKSSLPKKTRENQPGGQSNATDNEWGKMKVTVDE